MLNCEQFNLESHHARCFDALLIVDSVLKRNDIDYILLAGSTLGAVRHGGFIPWDDDIDIGIYKKDIRRVAQLLMEELPNSFVYQDRYAVNGFPRLFGKIIDVQNGYGCIDLFPLIKTANSEYGRRVQWFNRKILFKLYKAKIGYANKREHANLAEEIKLKVALLLSKTVSMNTLEKWIDRNECKYEDLNDNKYYVILYGAHSRKNETIDAAWIKPYSYVSFNGIEFPTIGNIDAYLKNMYGDYMTPPKDDEKELRHSESFGY